MERTRAARKVDGLGRIVLPIELRRQLGIDSGDELAIGVEAGRLVLEKVEDHCVFCGGKDGLREYLGKRVCASCRAGIG
jgi:transcriptional pleiotropic regulator of transition state genes